MIKLRFPVTFLFVAHNLLSFAQKLPIDRNSLRAFTSNTRSETGLSGKDYWQWRFFRACFYIGQRQGSMKIFYQTGNVK